MSRKKIANFSYTFHFTLIKNFFTRNWYTHEHPSKFEEEKWKIYFSSSFINNFSNPIWILDTLIGWTQWAYTDTNVSIFIFRFSNRDTFKELMFMKIFIFIQNRLSTKNYFEIFMIIGSEFENGRNENKKNLMTSFLNFGNVIQLISDWFFYGYKRFEKFG